MSDDNNYQFALSSSTTGFLLTTEAMQSLRNAAQGGSGTKAFIQNQVASNSFYQWLAEEGSAAWIADTDANDSPVRFSEQKSGDNELDMIVSIVLNGGDDTNPFTVNGAPYYQVGLLNAVHNYNGTPLWHFSAPIGLASLAMKKALQYFVLDPIYNAIVKGIGSACSGSQA